MDGTSVIIALVLIGTGLVLARFIFYRLPNLPRRRRRDSSSDSGSGGGEGVGGFDGGNGNGGGD
jgi:uncharacterized membrane protein YgcG